MLLCHAGKNDTLGRTLLSILDPDKATDLYVASIEVSLLDFKIKLT